MMIDDSILPDDSIYFILCVIIDFNSLKNATNNEDKKKWKSPLLFPLNERKRLIVFWHSVFGTHDFNG